jgi:hypothetical protein
LYCLLKLILTLNSFSSLICTSSIGFFDSNLSITSSQQWYAGSTFHFWIHKDLSYWSMCYIGKLLYFICKIWIVVVRCVCTRTIKYNIACKMSNILSHRINIQYMKITEIIMKKKK